MKAKLNDLCVGCEFFKKSALKCGHPKAKKDNKISKYMLTPKWCPE